MRKSLNWIAAGIVGLSAMVGGAALVGCTQDVGTTRPEVKDLKEGVNMIDTRDPSVRMSVAYRAGTSAIYFETVVGPAKPEVYRKMAPSEPQNEMDLRILDKNGNTFYVLRGGDKYIDSSWDADITKSLQAKVDPAAREADFKLAHEAAIAMRGVLPANFADHIFHVEGFAAQPLPSEDPRMVTRQKEIQAAALKEKGYNQSAWYSNVYLETDLYSGQVCWAWICPAWHSATRMWVYQGGWSVALNACNHGRCYSDSGMGYKCYSSGGYFSSASLWGETNSGSNTSVSGGCTTPYSWNDGTGQHLCNSDASYELFQAKLGGYSGVQNNIWQVPGNTGNGDWNNFRYTDPNGNNFSCGPGSHSGSWQIPVCP